MHIFSITEENFWCFKSWEILIRLLLFIFLSYYCFPVEMLWTRLDLLYIVVYHPSKDFFQAYGVSRIGIQTACMIVTYDYRAVSVTACDTGPWFLWFQSKDSSHSHWQWNCGYQHLKEKMYRCLRMEFEFYLALARRKKEIKLGRLFGWDRKNRGHVSQKVWHDKDPSLVNGRKCRTQP